MYSRSKTKAFISFDYDNDQALKHLLVGQARNPDTPFEISDMSVKEELIGDWKAKVRPRIKQADQMIVLCGKYMPTATGVSIEIRIAQEERIPYFLLAGYGDSKRPLAALASDKMYEWTWDNLKTLLAGGR